MNVLSLILSAAMLESGIFEKLSSLELLEYVILVWVDECLRRIEIANVPPSLSSDGEDKSGGVRLNDSSSS